MAKREQVATAAETGLIAQAQAEYEALRAKLRSIISRPES